MLKRRCAQRRRSDALGSAAMEGEENRLEHRNAIDIIQGIMALILLALVIGIWAGLWIPPLP